MKLSSHAGIKISICMLVNGAPGHCEMYELQIVKTKCQLREIIVFNTPTITKQQKIRS